MFVTDLRHLLDLPEDTPGPTRRRAEQLASIVRAATAGEAATGWETALRCRRRPCRRACPGRLIVLRTHAEHPIQWQCGACDAQGMISSWEGSPFDLRDSGVTVAETAQDIVLDDEVVAALQELRLDDLDRERLVFRIHTHHDTAVLTVTDEDLEQLIRFVAAKTNHERNRRRRRRLISALHALTQQHDQHLAARSAPTPASPADRCR